MEISDPLDNVSREIWIWREIARRFEEEVDRMRRIHEDDLRELDRLRDEVNRLKAELEIARIINELKG